jgi:hypothetical protein
MVKIHLVQGVNKNKVSMKELDRSYIDEEYHEEKYVEGYKKLGSEVLETVQSVQSVQPINSPLGYPSTTVSDKIRKSFVDGLGEFCESIDENPLDGDFADEQQSKTYTKKVAMSRKESSDANLSKDIAK